jgi:Zn-dependent protease with chaperone function
MEVHVTGRRILATIVDLIIFSIFFWLLSLAFGSTSVEGGSVAFSLGALGSLIYLVGVFAYYLFMEGYLG